MKYIIIKDTGLGSLFRMDRINRELYKISRPIPDPKDVTLYFLPEFHKAEIGALGFTDTDSLPVSYDMNVTALKAILSDDVDETEKRALELYLEYKTEEHVLFSDIIPRNMKVYTRKEMIALGWLASQLAPLK